MDHTKYISRVLTSLLLVIIASVQLPAQELKNNNCKIVMGGGVYLVMQDMHLNNNGVVTAGKSNVLFTGKQSTGIGGNNPVTFNNIIINKNPGKTLGLQQNISVAGILTMNNGNILLNGRQLDLGKTGTIAGESSQSYITGTGGGSVLANRIMATAPTAENPGNIGIELTSNIALGNVLIERRHIQEMMPGGIPGIHRSFNISSSVSGEKEVAVRLYYLDEELNGADETQLNIWTGSDISNSWILAGKNSSDMVNNWVFQKGLDRLGRFTLASPGISFRETNARKVVKDQSVQESISRIIVYPNPSTDKCTVEFSSNEAKQVTLKLYDQRGQLLHQKNIRCVAGMNRVVWELGKYAAGIYFITDNTGLVNIKINKQ